MTPRRRVPAPARDAEPVTLHIRATTLALLDALASHLGCTPDIAAEIAITRLFTAAQLPGVDKASAAWPPRSTHPHR